MNLRKIKFCAKTNELKRMEKDQKPSAHSMTDGERRVNPIISRRNFMSLSAGVFATYGLYPSLLLAKSLDPMNLTSLTIKEAADLVRNLELSPVELTEACLSRIEELNPMLNAFISITAKEALAQARIAEKEILRGKWRGPLHGIPIALKDNIDTAGIRTTAASAVFADRVPKEDAEVVRRLKDAGAVLLGKLNMHEFAWEDSSVISYWGPVQNPWALDYEAGGSSGGSAAAVAADLCFGALGTDTGASIRLPAAHCGVVGLKPTYGLVSNRGTIPAINSFDHVGPISKTVKDAALMLQAIAGYDPDWPESKNVSIPNYDAAVSDPYEQTRIGIPRPYFYDGLDEEVEKVVAQALETVYSMAASVENVNFPADTLYEYSALLAERWAFFRPYFEKARILAQPVYRKAFAENKTLATAERYVLTKQRLNKRRREIIHLFNDIDLLVTPTVQRPPRTIKEQIERVSSNKPLPTELHNTMPFNVFGNPAISVPCGFTKSGLPIGLQIAGAPLCEGKVLAFASEFERRTKWHLRKPKIRL